MSGPYRTLRDHVSIRHDGRDYHIALTKEITPAGDRPVECLYGRIWPILFPDDPALCAQHADHYPLDMSQIDLRVTDSEGRSLPYEINHRYSQYVEIRIPFQGANDAAICPIYPGQLRAITYSFRMTHEQWGPHVERRLVRNTDTFSVELCFPFGLASVSGYTISGASRSSLIPQIHHRVDGDHDVWSWERASPDWDDRYRLSWKFSDQRESKFEEKFKNFLNSKVSNETQFSINNENKVLYWNGDVHKVSDTQLICIKEMYKKYLEGHTLVHQKPILAAARSNSLRLRDVFKHSNLLNSLIVSKGGGYYSLDVRGSAK